MKEKGRRASDHTDYPKALHCRDTLMSPLPPIVMSDGTDELDTPQRHTVRLDFESKFVRPNAVLARVKPIHY